MIKKKIVGVIFQVPAWILIFGSVFAGFYASIKGINNISFAVPFVLLIISILYIVGRLMVRGSGSEEEYYSQPSEEEQKYNDRY